MADEKRSLRRELLGALATVFAGALIVAIFGVLLLLPSFGDPVRALIYIVLLLSADVAIFAVFGRRLIRERILAPLEHMVEEAEGIAGGDYGRRLPPGDTLEIHRLAASLNRMAGRLIEHQRDLTENIESLEETNRELTEARDELIRAEKMASLGQMAAGVAHEIGNPLTAIMGNVDLLIRRTDGDETDLLTSTAEQIRRIDRIVRGLLDYSRVRDSRARPINVNDVVSSASDLIKSQGRFGGVDVDVEMTEDLPSVEVDPYQLEQVLVNLILNAADAMAEADVRRLEIRTSTRVYEAPKHTPARRRDDPPGIDYSHRRRFNRPERVPRIQPFDSGTEIVEIRVRDTGHGIPEDLINNVFEPFVTTKEPGKGTGLGLAVSARLVDGMGGTIRAGNTEVGAEFTLQLPASDLPAEAHAP